MIGMAKSISADGPKNWQHAVAKLVLIFESVGCLNVHNGGKEMLRMLL